MLYATLGTEAVVNTTIVSDTNKDLRTNQCDESEEIKMSKHCPTISGEMDRMMTAKIKETQENTDETTKPLQKTNENEVKIETNTTNRNIVFIFNGKRNSIISTCVMLTCKLTVLFFHVLK